MNAEYREKGKMIYGTKFAAKDVLRDLLPHETNQHCLNSLRWDVIHPKDTTIKQENTQFYKQVARDMPYPRDRV